MAYVTTTQLSARLGSTVYARLTDRVNGTTANDTVGQQLVDEAQAEFESYVATRYATPLDLTAHAELRRAVETHVLDIAEYFAWRGSPFVSDVPTRIHDLYAESLAWLRDVAAAKVDLPAAAPLRAAVAESDAAR